MREGARGKDALNLANSMQAIDDLVAGKGVRHASQFAVIPALSRLR
jgi:hypothetical protein